MSEAIEIEIAGIKVPKADWEAISAGCVAKIGPIPDGMAV